MRRIELRRLLWTFANHLGAEELTWEAIEVAAVVGTLEPHVPVVTGPEFFRCVLKTVHLVAAELQQRLQEALKRNEPRHTRPQDVVQEEPEGYGAAPDVDAPAAPAACDDPGPRDPPARPPPSRPAAEAVPLFSPAPVGSPGLDDGRPEELLPPQAPPMPPEAEVFTPAPGGHGDETAAINGMMALTLSTEGTFDPQRLFVGAGSLVLRDPEEDSPPSVLDLREMETATTGGSIAHAPVARMLPGYVRTAEALERMLVLEFDGGEVICLWFPTTEDCTLCLDAVKEEAVAALERDRNNTGPPAAAGVGRWMAGLFGGDRKEASG